MERRSWPWKKKKSSVKASTAADSSDQVNTKRVNYVELSSETYAHLIAFEDQVKILKEKLSLAQAEITNNDSLVKQHSKVAEDAVLGWEKAEAEAMSLKQYLESVTLQKLTAENRASNLDAAIKECMNQMEISKKDSEQKLHDIVFTNTEQWENLKSELEAQMINFEEQLQRSHAENASLARSLQERSNLLMKISEEKSHADVEIEMLKSNIVSCEREMNSLKYELHVVSKEIEIRSEEKNMSLRSVEAANKQRIEDVRKIGKLEADCQRLRSLVRKKLPGNAALAQMKLEVEYLGRDCGETRSPQSNTKSSSPFSLRSPKYSENTQQCHKENEVLTARVLEMEEEIKMQREALFMSNNELNASRTTNSKSSNRFRSVEGRKILNQQKSPSKPGIDQRSLNGSMRHNKSILSLTTMSEDGIDEEGSCCDSWTTSVKSEFSPFKKERVAHSRRSDSSSHLELMDDFLEMERLAFLSTETNEIPVVSNGVMDTTKTKISDGTKDYVLMSKLRLRLSSILESQVLDTDIAKVLDNIRDIFQDMQDELPCPSSCLKVNVPSPSASFEQNTCQDSNSGTVTKHNIDELRKAISQIHDIVVPVCKESIEMQKRCSDDHGLRERFENFSGFVDKIPHIELSLNDYICALSDILTETRKLSFDMLSGRINEVEITSIDCIDKVTLLEKKIVQLDGAKERFSTDCTFLSASDSDPEISQERDIPGFELKTISIEEFEQTKLEKDNMQIDLARCNESLKHTKFQLGEMEQQLAELKSQLASCQTSNNFADTRLRCMTESYKSLELHKKELENEINHLRSEVQDLFQELQEERRNHQDEIARHKDLVQEQIERRMACSICSSQSEADVLKIKQDREYASAAEKLAECQESIFLLGKQLKAMHPPNEQVSFSNVVYQISDDERRSSRQISPPRAVQNSKQVTVSEQNVVAPNTQRTNLNTTEKEANSVAKPVTNIKRPKQRSRSASSSSLASMIGEKQGRGFSRFFFQKD